MPNDWLHVPWLLFMVFWFAAAGASKRTMRREAIPNMILHGGLLTLAFLLLFHTWRLNGLNARFVPATETFWLCGFVLTTAGLGFAIWARLRLGRNWSSAVTIKLDHRLIHQGPYRLVRHPMYFGLLLAALGTAIGYGRMSCLLGVPVAFLAFWVKSRMEEQFMVAQFGARYIQYQRDVKRFIPGLF